MHFFSKLIDMTPPAVMVPRSGQRNAVVAVFGQPTAGVPASRLSYLGGATTYSSHKTEEQLIIRDPDSQEVKTLYPTGEVLQGTLNYLVLFSDQSRNLYTWRTPKEHPEILPQIHKDLIGTGFLTSGGRYKFRTLQEQVSFMKQAHRANLQNLVPAYADQFGILSPFVQGTPYNQYLLLGGIFATKNVLDNIMQAHQQNIVYGDRWTKNTIVQLDESIVEIDFDIELMGENAQEFEMAQLLYHIIFFSSRRVEMLKFLKAYFQNNPKFFAQHNLSTIKQFLLNYINYFQDKPVEGILGGIKQEIAELIRMLSAMNHM